MTEIKNFRTGIKGNSKSFQKNNAKTSTKTQSKEKES